ncbi:MAG: hypothetical protein U0791_07850 [Gemmataceae bacterium]
MRTVQLRLPDEGMEIADRLLANGRWESFEALVMAGLLRLEEDLQVETPDFADEVRLGLEQAGRGELVDGPPVLQRLRNKLEASRKLPA